ncbi:jg20928, partial [Pararge aegeria aegeria]
MLASFAAGCIFGRGPGLQQVRGIGASDLLLSRAYRAIFLPGRAETQLSAKGKFRGIYHIRAELAGEKSTAKTLLILSLDPCQDQATDLPIIVNPLSSHYLQCTGNGLTMI